MNDQTDQQLLLDYAERQSEAAFATLVQRYIDLVYSAAFRMVCDAHAAKDVTQAVFVALAQNARQLTDRPALAGWLHGTARNLAVKAIRSDIRRRSREQEAMIMNGLLSTESDVAWEQIAPHLDDALAELSEPDRDAVLLRYFKNHDLRTIGATLGISDDAAQKRVSRAVERLREFFAKRGVTVGASGLAVVISAHAVQAAPAGLALTISAAAALTGTTIATTTTATATNVIAMTALQKAAIAATVIVLAGAGIYEAHQAAQLHDKVRLLQQQQEPLSAQIERLHRALNDATNKLAGLESDNERLNRNTAELLKLRGEAGRWRNDAQELARLQSGTNNDSTVSEAMAWRERANRLKGHLEQHPNAGIPELQLATDQDWLDAARSELQTEEDFRRAMSALRWTVTTRFASKLQTALGKYLKANAKQFPTDLLQLQSYFDNPVDEAILRRYAILPKERISSLGMGGDWIISPKAAVDEEFDSRVGIGPNGWGSTGPHGWNELSHKVLEPAYQAYLAANAGREPSQPEEILPYLKTPEERAAYDKALKFLKTMRK